MIHTHEQAIDALCGCAATVSVLSYQEAIEGYFKLRGLDIPPNARRRPDMADDLDLGGLDNNVTNEVLLTMLDRLAIAMDANKRPMGAVIVRLAATRLRTSEAATAAAVERAGWQDISTAPRDGTWIQAWREPPSSTGGTWEPLVYVRWEDEEGEWVWPDGDYQVFTERGIEIANMNIADFENYASDNFTHWQPLPAPPAPVAEEAHD